MNNTQLYTEIENLLQLIKRWDDRSTPSAIERDIALNKLRILYEHILTLETHCHDVENNIVEENLSVADNNSEEEIIETSSIAQTEYVEEEESQEEEQQEVKAQVVADTLCKLSINPQSNRENRGKVRAILEAALDEIFDNEEETPKETPKETQSQDLSMSEIVEETVTEEVVISKEQYTISEKEVEETPITKKEQISIEIIDVSERKREVEEEVAAQPYTTQVLGDTMSTTTLADQFANSSTTHFISEQVSDRSLTSLGINERYFIARELFNEDTQLCNDMLCRLDSFNNYDDCMIYIAENYSWRSDSEAARYVLELINNKFNIL